VPFPYHHKPSDLVVSLLAECASSCNRNILTKVAGKLRPQDAENHTAFVKAISRISDLKAYDAISKVTKQGSFDD
jgi:hypothetical protein